MLIHNKIIYILLLSSFVILSKESTLILLTIIPTEVVHIGRKRRISLLDNQYIGALVEVVGVWPVRVLIWYLVNLADVL